MQEQVQEQNQEQQKSPVLLPISKDGQFLFSNQVELASMARLLIQIKLAPEHLRKDGVEAVMSAAIFCQQRGLPLSAMNEIGFIKGKVAPFGTLFTSLAQRHPEYGETVVLFIDEKQEVICLENKNLNADVWACVIRIKKKGSSSFNEYFFTKDEAKTAGLLGNNTYQKYLKDMLYHKTKARAFKVEYASALDGIESYEDLLHEGARDVTEELNEKIKNGTDEGEFI